MAKKERSRAQFELLLKQSQAEAAKFEAAVEDMRREIEQYHEEQKNIGAGLQAANGVRLVPLEQVAHALHVATCLIDSSDEVSSIAVSDFACLIDNQGTECERAEAILAIVGIAERVNDRIEECKRKATLRMRREVVEPAMAKVRKAHAKR